MIKFAKHNVLDQHIESYDQFIRNSPCDGISSLISDEMCKHSINQKCYTKKEYVDWMYTKKFVTTGELTKPRETISPKYPLIELKSGGDVAWKLRIRTSEPLTPSTFRLYAFGFNHLETIDLVPIKSTDNYYDLTVDGCIFPLINVPTITYFVELDCPEFIELVVDWGLFSDDTIRRQLVQEQTFTKTSHNSYVYKDGNLFQGSRLFNKVFVS